MTGENGEFQSKSTDIRLTIQIEVKMGEKKTTFEKYGENFTILQEKIPSIKSEMTGENAKFPDEFKKIRLTIQMEVKIAQKNKTTFVRGNLHKISQF